MLRGLLVLVAVFALTTQSYSEAIEYGRAVLRQANGDVALTIVASEEDGSHVFTATGQVPAPDQIETNSEMSIFLLNRGDYALGTSTFDDNSVFNPGDKDPACPEDGSISQTVGGRAGDFGDYQTSGDPSTQAGTFTAVTSDITGNVLGKQIILTTAACPSIGTVVAIGTFYATTEASATVAPAGDASADFTKEEGCTDDCSGRAFFSDSSKRLEISLATTKKEFTASVTVENVGTFSIPVFEGFGYYTYVSAHSLNGARLVVADGSDEILSGVLGSTTEDRSMNYKMATVTLQGTAGNEGVSGTVTFLQEDSEIASVKISGTISGLTEGEHAFHVHELGDITATDGTSAGGHYNPAEVAHGCYPDNRHVGDIGNIDVGSDGSFSFEADYTRDLLTLHGDNSIIGRAIIIHAGADNCTGASGYAGARVAMGVIGVRNTGANQQSVQSNVFERAVAVIGGTSNCPSCKGTVYFEHSVGTVTVYARLSGFNVHSSHAIHIHEFGDLSKSDGTSAGGHYNPDGNEHKLPSELQPYHVGDLGNAEANWEGEIYLYKSYSVPELYGANSIIGRAVVLHEGADKGHASQPSGGAGSRFAFGVIGIRTAELPEVEVSPPAPNYVGIAMLKGTVGNEGFSAVVTISAKEGNDTAEINLAVLGGIGLTDKKALHVHVYGDTFERDGTSAGGHYNPNGVAHACFPTEERHVGDIGNFDPSNGQVQSFESNLIKLSGDQSVIGRSIVLHMGEDDCTGASGNAGPRLAVGVVGIAALGDDDNHAAASTTLDPATDVRSQLFGTTHCASCSGWINIHPTGTGGVAEVTVSVSTSMPLQTMSAYIVDAIDLEEPEDAAHFNPFGGSHGAPDKDEANGGTNRHAGDLGDFATGVSGSGSYSSTLSLLHVDGEKSVVGRGVVICKGDVATESCQPLLNGVLGIGNGNLVVSSSLEATVTLQGTAGNEGVSGTVTFLQEDSEIASVKISGTISGLTEGEHAFHVHELGDITATDGTSAGGHYNPAEVAHGCYPDNRHVGDIGNIDVGSDGSFSFEADYTRDLLTLHGDNSIIGRAIIIHAGADNCTGASGYAGARVAMGVIGIKASNLVTQPSGASQTRSLKAVASLRGTDHCPACTGTVFLDEDDSGVRVYARIAGVTEDSRHGFHIHAYGDISLSDGTSAGGHFNPDNNAHGIWAEGSDLALHAGDLGNVKSEWNGQVYHDKNYTGLFSLSTETSKSVVGRAFVLHERVDDGGGSSGNAGKRLAYGVIGVRSSDFPIIEPVPYEPFVSEAIVTFGHDGSGASGDIVFRTDAEGNDVTVTGQVSGLPAGQVLLSVYELGDVSDPSDPSRLGDLLHCTTMEVPQDEPLKLPSDFVLNNWVLADIVGGALMFHVNDSSGHSVVHNTTTCGIDGIFYGKPTAWGVIGIRNSDGNRLTASGSSDYHIAIIHGTANCPSCAGYVYSEVVAPNQDIKLTVNLHFKPSNDSSSHGFHLHEYGDLTDDSGVSAGGHYNPLNSEHGLPDSGTSHMGDLGNVVAKADGSSTGSVTFSHLHRSGPFSFVGRSFVIHAEEDTGAYTGGVRVAFGVIGKASSKSPEGTNVDPTKDDDDSSSSGPTGAAEAQGMSIAALLASAVVGLWWV